MSGVIIFDFQNFERAVSASFSTLVLTVTKMDGTFVIILVLLAKCYILD